MNLLTSELIEELAKDMSLDRLTLTGLFIKIGGSTEPEARLYRAVLDRALIDSFSTNASIKGPVDRWLKINNPDFLDSCALANLEPSIVMEIFTAMHKILTGDKARVKDFQ